MANFSTIHVFGFGDTQIIGKDNKGMVKSSELTKLETFVTHVKTFLPATGVTLTDYHVIHIFDKNEVKYLGQQAQDKKANTSFSVKWAQINEVILNEFVDEIISKLPPAVTE